jgi:hypothetical protein
MTSIQNVSRFKFPCFHPWILVDPCSRRFSFSFCCGVVLCFYFVLFDDHIFLLTAKRMIISETLAIKIAEVSVILFLEVN